MIGKSAILRTGIAFRPAVSSQGEESENESSHRLCSAAFVLRCLRPSGVFGNHAAVGQRPAQVPGSRPTGTQTTTLPPQSRSPGSAPLRVMVGKSLLINTTERLKRISVTDPAIAYAQVITPTQILVHGKSPGEVSLLIWDELERSRSFDLRVDVDVSACAEEEHRVFPDEQITVTPSRSAIVLSGHVSTEDVAKRAGELASAYSPKVVNVLTFGPVGAQEVLLQVKFAEVDRTALTQMGVNFVSTGAGNTIGTVTTGQYRRLRACRPLTKPGTPVPGTRLPPRRSDHQQCPESVSVPSRH